MRRAMMLSIIAWLREALKRLSLRGLEIDEKQNQDRRNVSLGERYDCLFRRQWKVTGEFRPTTESINQIADTPGGL